MSDVVWKIFFTHCIFFPALNYNYPSQSDDPLSTLLPALSSISGRLSLLSSSLPGSAAEAEEAALRARRRSNAQNVWVGISIAGGGLAVQAGESLT